MEEEAAARHADGIPELRVVVHSQAATEGEAAEMAEDGEEGSKCTEVNGRRKDLVSVIRPVCSSSAGNRCDSFEGEEMQELVRHMADLQALLPVLKCQLQLRKWSPGCDSAACTSFLDDADLEEEKASDVDENEDVKESQDYGAQLEGQSM